MNKEKLKQMITIFSTHLKGSDIASSSTVIAFYTLLSIFPLAIFMGNILPLFRIDVDAILGYASIIIPATVLPVIEPIIRNLLTTSSGSFLSISAISAIWAAGKGVDALQKGLNKTYGITKGRNFLINRIVSVAAILAFVLVMMVLTAFLSVGQLLIQQLTPSLRWLVTLSAAISGLKWPVTLTFLFLFLVMFYRFIPSITLKFKQVLPGSILAAFGLFLLVEIFTLYLRYSASTFSTYGALSAFFVLMFWLNFVSRIILMGSVFNVSWYQFRNGEAPTETYSFSLQDILRRLRNRKESDQ